MSEEPTKPRQPHDPAGTPAPDAPQPAPTQATTPLNRPQPERPEQAAAGEQPHPVTDTPHGAEQNANPQATATETGAAAPPPPPPPPPPVVVRQPGGFGRFARHRATQIVAAGIVGLVIGGGVVALIDNDGPRNRPGNVSQYDRGPRGDFGPFRDGPPRGPRQRQQQPQPQDPQQPPQPPGQQQPSTTPSPSAPPSTSTTPS